MTVNTQRTQGGSSLKDGHIEIMQHRRLYYSDDKGIGEAYNEVDSTGKGIQVPATYHWNIMNTDAEESSQRII